jgi:thioredoxin-related protein
MGRLCLLSIIYLFSITTVSAQNIAFSENKKWEDVLASAKSSGKLVFVDVYTDWCGPCKLMDKEVFTQKSIAQQMNEGFINYKMNAEKGDGIGLSKHYNVFSYPTYLFINGNGTLIYRANGYMAAEEFDKEIANAKAEQHEPVTLLEMDSIYSTVQNDTAFLYTYLRKRTKLKQDNTDLLDEYCTLLNPGQQASLQTLQLIADNGAFYNKSLQIGKALSLLKQHQSQLSNLKDADDYESYLYIARDVTLSKAILQQSDSLLQLVMDANKELSPELHESDSDFMLKLRYYSGTDQSAKYIDTALVFLKEHLLQIADSSLAKKDKAILDNVAKSMTNRLKDKSDKEKQEALASYKHTQTIEWIRTAKTVCTQLAKFSNRKTIFQQGRLWTARIVRLAESDTAYYKYVYPDCLRVHAIYLYKSGLKQEAIRFQTKAVAQINLPGIAKEDDDIKAYKATLDKMKAGKF